MGGSPQTIIAAVTVKKPNRIMGGGTISTYEELILIVEVATLMVLILTYTRKK